MKSEVLISLKGVFIHSAAIVIKFFSLMKTQTVKVSQIKTKG